MPAAKFPCRVCKKAVRAIQRAFHCDRCQVWQHVGCNSDLLREYDQILEDLSRLYVDLRTMHKCGGGTDGDHSRWSRAHWRRLRHWHQIQRTDSTSRRGHPQCRHSRCFPGHRGWWRHHVPCIRQLRLARGELEWSWWTVMATPIPKSGRRQRSSVVPCLSTKIAISSRWACTPKTFASSMSRDGSCSGS